MQSVFYLSDFLWTGEPEEPAPNGYDGDDEDEDKVNKDISEAEKDEKNPGLADKEFL